MRTMLVDPKRVDEQYEEWIQQHSRPEDRRKLAEDIYALATAQTRDGDHYHLFINKHFKEHMVNSLAAALKSWPEEVAAWSVAFGTPEFSGGASFPIFR